MDIHVSNQKKLARRAGLFYLTLAFLGFYGIMYVSSRVMVAGEPAATMENLLANEFMFRTGILCLVLNTAVFSMMVITFYQLFKGINDFLNKIMVAFVLVHVPVVFVTEALNLTALLVAKGTYLPSLDDVARQEWVYLLLKTSKFGSINLAMMFWGLWLIPLGMLVIKSDFIPKIFGTMLIIGGIAYMIESTKVTLFPSVQHLVFQALFVLYSIAEISFMLWLLIKGVRTVSTNDNMA